MSNTSNHNAQVVDQFSQQAAGYAQLTSSLVSDRAQALCELLQPNVSDVVLEVCCGPGALALDIAPRVGEVTGMDLTPAMLEQAKARQIQKDVSNISWLVGDANSIPFEDHHFTIVMCSAAFHHLEKPRRVFAEMVRVCRPGGRILIKDVTPAADKVERYDSVEKMRDPSHTHALTVDEMSALGAGLAVQQVSLTTTATSALPLEAVLKTSFPESCTLDDIRSLFRADALTGADQLGFRATLVGDEIYVTYPMTTALWRRGL